MQRKDSMELPKQDATSKVALQILRYLNENPNASDTASGILEWWLLKQSISEEQDVVQRALDALVEQNLVLFVTSADGRKHYYFNSEQAAASRKLIGHAKEDES